MKTTVLKFAFLIVFFGLSNPSYSQLVTPSCVHGGGIKFLLDAYLASIGACNCQRSGVILTSMPNFNTGVYELVFEDNFDGDSLQLSKWEVTGNQGALEGGQNTGVYTLNNVNVFDGVCHLTSKKETITKRTVSWDPDNKIMSDGLPNLRTFEYTSGMIQTRKKFLYGKYEIRCKMPSGKGFWPAFWFFGGKRWNEIDVFDNYAGINEFVTSIGHDFEGIGKPNGCNATYRFYDFSKWHTFTCQYEYDKIIFMIDNEIVREIYRALSQTGNPVLCGDKIDYGTYFQLEAFPIEEMNLILNLALISKQGPGKSVPIDETTAFPSSFDIDYVRCWHKIPESIQIYPNPTKDYLNIDNANGFHVSIINMLGQQVFASQIDQQNFQINLSSLKCRGLYFVQILNTKGNVVDVRKIILQ